MDKVLIGHGSGGRLMHELIRESFAPAFDIKGVSDSAILQWPAHEDGAGGASLAVTTDSFVVSPLFFPGGDIGDLAVNGTVNDLVVAGARPLYLTAGFIIEEGLPLADLRRVIASMAAAASRAGVSIVAGDTKVVERGKGDGLFINTTGVGLVDGSVGLSASGIRPGDAIIVSGPIGNHGMAVMAERNGLSFDTPLLSDTAPLVEPCRILLQRPGDVRVMRDPTRGGLATTLKEFALECGLCMVIQEDAIPLDDAVAGACDLLGLDPMYVANEGILVAVVQGGVSEYLLERLRGNPLCGRAAIIGRVEKAPESAVVLETSIGGRRLVDMLEGGQLPRIC